MSQYTAGTGGLLTPKTPAEAPTADGPFGIAVGPEPTPDTTAPSVSCSATPATVTSKNHKLITVTTSVSVTDEAGGSGAAGFTLLSVTSSEPDSGLARDDKPTDIQGWTTATADTSGQLRAERYATSRVYTMTYQGSDNAGNTANCQTTTTIASKK